MRPVLNLRAAIPHLLVVLGWIMRCNFVEVAGTVTTHVRRK
jgi:hypothetical protein